MSKKFFLNVILPGMILAAAATKLFAAGFSGDFSQPSGALYDSGFDDQGCGVAVDSASAGGPYAYVVGYASCTGNADIMVTKYDGATGWKILSTVFNSSTPAYGTAVAVDGAGSVYVAGYTELSGYYGNMILKLRFDSDTVVIQSSAVFTDGANFKVSAVALSGADVYVAGGSGKALDGALLRFNSALVYQSSTSLRGMCEGLAVDRSGNIVAAHYASNDETMVSRFTASLALISSTTITGPGTGNSTAAHAVAIDADNTVFVTGCCGAGPYQTFVLKFSDTLTLVSSVTYGCGDTGECGYGIGVDSGNCVYVGGSAHNGANSDTLLLKYDNDLVFLSSHMYNAGNDEYGRGIALDQYNAVYLTGYAMNSAGTYDHRTVKYSPCQPTLTWTGETGYTSGGVYPGSAQTGAFVYRVTYTDKGNISPASGYPRVYIVRRNKPSDSPSVFTMAAADAGDTNYADGKIYTFTGNLPARDQYYAYLFEARNADNYPANGPATMLQAGPDVSGVFSGSFAVPGGAVYDSGVNDIVQAIAVDKADNRLLVAGSSGYSSVFSDYYIVEYDISTGGKTGCVTFDRGSLDYAYGLYTAGGNTYVAGCAHNGSTYDAVTLLYDQYLTLQSSAAFDGGGHDIGFDVARDGAGSVFVCGCDENGTDEDAFLIKYDAALVLQSTVTFNGGGDDVFYKLAIGPSNQIFAVGASTSGPDSNGIICRYDDDLVLLSSAVFNSSSDDRAYSVAVDSTGNVYVAGYFNNGADNDWFVTKYSSSLVLLASATFNNGGWDIAEGMAFDPQGNLYVGGNAGTNVIMTRSYDRNLVFRSSVTYDSGRIDYCAGVATDNNGHIFVACQSLNGSGNFDYRTVRYSSSAFTVQTPAPAPDPEPEPAPAPDPNRASGTVSPDAAAEFVISPVSGEIRVSIPVRCFAVPVTFAVSTAVPCASDRATVKLTGTGFEITAGGAQPLKEITVTVHYRDTDIDGLEEGKLALAWYDETHGRWIVLPSTAYPEENRVVGRTRHLSLFALVQLAPADGLSSVVAYPNPFNPARQANMTIDNLPAAAGLKLYTVTGELVRTIDYPNATGRAYWDGKNDGGVRVASGVYLLFINSGEDGRKLKIAVQK